MRYFLRLNEGIEFQFSFVNSWHHCTSHQRSPEMSGDRETGEWLHLLQGPYHSGNQSNGGAEQGAVAAISFLISPSAHISRSRTVGIPPACTENWSNTQSFCPRLV